MEVLASFRHAFTTQSSHGIGELRFSTIDGKTVRFHGSFMDVEGSTRFNFMGWKMQDKRVLASLNDPTSPRDTVVEFARNHMHYVLCDKTDVKPRPKNL